MAGDGLPDSISMAVPGSFSEVFTETEKRDYCGDFWYETEFYLPSDHAGKKQYIRFGSVTNRCRVYCNGVLVAEHEGGFLPVVADVTDVVVADGPNRLVVWVNNQLNETSMPCGAVKTTRTGRRSMHHILISLISVEFTEVYGWCRQTRKRSRIIPWITS
ncbi:MAG: sugar-binding domain-containing protein [Lachnospiraceae bacterium]